jgi:D-alanyl-D-alanine carboxypeptidase/D-alanyl-D-alanine-endopeptidase (penicillin-binding protein 4)
MPLGTNVFTGDLTFHNPAGRFGVFFKEALQRHGVKVSGKVRTVNWLDPQAQPADCAGQIELGWMESLPLNEIAREIQKPSQNLYTDLLLAHVGEKCRSADDPPVMSSEDLGIRELNKFLSEAGIAPGEVLFEEGSGLSRNNLTTPNATVTLLSFMSRHRSATAYLEALPVAGVDGTLRNRLKGTAAAGNLRAKTGSLRWASSLSGYVTTAAGERLAFCFMLNRYHNPTGLPRAELDALAVQLAGLCARSED